MNVLSLRAFSIGVFLILPWTTFSQNVYEVRYNKHDSLLWRVQLGDTTLSLIRGEKFKCLLVHGTRKDSVNIGYSEILQSPINDRYVVLAKGVGDEREYTKLTASDEFSPLLNSKTKYCYLVGDELIGFEPNFVEAPPKKVGIELTDAPRKTNRGPNDQWRTVKLIVAKACTPTFKKIMNQ